MTEISFPWDGTSVGDATLAEYSSKEFIQDWLQLTLVYDRTLEGVIDTNYAGLTGGLQVAAGAGVVTVQTGAAIVDGRLYKNTAVLTLTPSSGSRVDRVVLRRDVAAQTVRAVIKEGTAGTPPALTQNDAIWEISLAQFVVTAGPTIGTVTREARAIRTPLGPGYQSNELAADDTSFPATGWQSIGPGVSVTLGPGKWLIWGVASGQAITTAGTRGLRVRNTTMGTTHGEAITQVAASDNWNMATPPTVEDLSSTQTVELQFNVGNTSDIVFGVTATAIIAMRVI